MPLAKVNPAGGSGLDEGRDGWCTPKWLADLLGNEIGVDPCSNERSHIRAGRRISYGLNSNGLLDDLGERWVVHGYEPFQVSRGATVFVNPPYARGQVVRWVRHWMDTHFVFLLRWDPSTKWFSELLPRCTHVWFPNRRVNFEPPPGVVASSNPYPHALYLREPKVTLLERLSAAGYLIPVDRGAKETDSGLHVDLETGVGNRGSPGGAGRADVGAGRQEAAACLHAGTPNHNLQHGEPEGVAPWEAWPSYFGQAAQA